jgi:hypothetical protein
VGCGALRPSRKAALCDSSTTRLGRGGQAKSFNETFNEIFNARVKNE